MEDREKAGLVTPGPANFEALKKSLVEISNDNGRVSPEP